MALFVTVMLLALLGTAWRLLHRRDTTRFNEIAIVGGLAVNGLQTLNAIAALEIPWDDTVASLLRIVRLANFK